MQKVKNTLGSIFVLSIIYFFVLLEKNNYFRGTKRSLLERPFFEIPVNLRDSQLEEYPRAVLPQYLKLQQVSNDRLYFFMK